MKRVAAALLTILLSGAGLLGGAGALGGVGMAGAAVHASTHHAKVISKKAARKQYLALIGPSKAASATFGHEAAEWGGTTTDAEALSDAQPLIASIERLNQGLRADRWPPNARAAIKALIEADDPLISDLQSLATLRRSAASAWVATFRSDGDSLTLAAGSVRRDPRTATGHPMT